VDVFKRNLIAETPNVLIVHLQRIVFNFDTFQNDKINSRFEFPNILNLKDFSFREVMKSEGRPNEIMYSEEMKHLMDISDEEYTYKLVGVNIHVGTAEYGHYYSLINTKRGSEEVDEHKVEWTQTEKDTWKVFEDDKIKAYSFSDLRCDSFGGNQQSNMNENEMNAYLTNTGGSYGKNAYMLVYERMKKKQLTEIITNEDELHKVNVSLDCANTATSRAAAPQTTSNKRLLDFRKVTPYVPSWIKDKILEDNSSNLIDQHIFSEGFFNIVKSVFKHIADHVLLTQHRYGLDHIQYFNRIKKTTLKIARKSMFDLLAYFF
jgi:ubiquitin carboxyl-terminal hydrolase 34